MKRFLLFAFVILWVSAALSKGDKKNPATNFRVIGALDTMYVNNIFLPFMNDGSTAEDAQAYYPNPGLPIPPNYTLSFLFQGGLASSGYVNGDLRCSWMAKASLIQEWQPGEWGMDPDDPLAKFYTVTVEDGPGSPAYLNWADAVTLGAEFIDLNGDGVYDPWLDRPALLGDKTSWTVFNDGTDISIRAVGLQTPPMGLEIQQTVWAYQHGDPLDDVIFFHWRIINADSGDVDSLIYSLWADGDIGDYQDDLIGCDTTLNTGYIYNNGPDFNYGVNPPAFGAKILQGAVVESFGDTAYVYRGVVRGVDTLINKKNLAMTAFTFYNHSLLPPFPSPRQNAQRARYYQQGGMDGFGNPVDPTIFGTGGLPGDNPNFFYSGDPVTGAGWRDITTSDKIFLVNSGPFNIALGDTQDIIIAYVVGRGGDHLESITEMRQRANYLNEFFPWGYNLGITVNKTVHFVDSTFIFNAHLVSLSYRDTIQTADWQLIQQPPGSIAQLQPEPGFRALLTPDVGGEYTVRLQATVSGEILADTLGITAIDNQPLVASLTLSPSQIPFGSSILADASASSDPNGDTLHFDWTFPQWVFANIQDTAIIEFYPGRVGWGAVEVAVSDPYFTREAADSFSVTPVLDNLVPQLYWPQLNSIGQMRYVNSKIFALEKSDAPPRGLHIFDAGNNPGNVQTTFVQGSRFETDGTVLASYGDRPTVELYTITPNFELVLASDTVAYGSTGPRIRDIYLRFPYLFVPYTPPSEWRVYDVSDPLTPVQIASLPLPLFTDDAAYEGDIAVIYSRHPNFGLITYDISVPTNIIGLDTITYASAVNRFIAMDAQKIYITNRDAAANEVQVVDASQPDDLQLGGVITVDPLIPIAPAAILEMEAHGNLLILGLNYGVRLYDVSDPNAPVEIAHRLAGFPVYGTAWNDPQLYMVENGDPQFGAGYYYFDHVVGIEDNAGSPEVPQAFQLLQNYPNPFNPETTIGYQLPVSAKVELTVYNVLGQKIRQLVNRQQIAGSYQVRWDGKNDAGAPVASGIYLYKLKADKLSGGGWSENSFVQIRKMLLIK